MPNQHPAYTPDELAWLRTNYVTASKADILARLPTRTWTNIQNHAYKIGCNGRERILPVHGITTWTPDKVALLLDLYPTNGSKATAERLGLTRVAVLAEASRRKLAFIPAGRKPRPHRPYRPRKPKPALVAAAEPRPVLPPKPTPRPVAVKRAAGTPNLHIQKAQAARSEDAKKRNVVYTASEIRRQFKPNDPLRIAYTFHGDAGVRAYLKQQPA